MEFYGLFLICFQFCVVLSEKYSIDDASTNEISYRLPNNTKPENYDITIITYFDTNNFIFSGTVIIDLRVLEESCSITVHARQLTINLVRLMTKNGSPVKLKPFTYDPTTEFVTIPTQNQLIKDTNYILTLGYVGELRTDKGGFYATSYTNSKGETRQVSLLI